MYSFYGVYGFKIANRRERRTRVKKRLQKILKKYLSKSKKSDLVLMQNQVYYSLMII